MIKITNPKTFDEGFEEFIYSRRMNGCRDITIKHYENSIHVFQLYFDKIRMDELVESTVHKFFSHLKNLEDVNPLEKLKTKSEKFPGVKIS